MSKLVAIHQPNFFPWLGFFDKIRRADTFVFLDAVDYPRAGSGSMGSWTNRVRLAIQGEPRWVTCPVRRMPLGSPISAAMIDDTKPWRRKLLNTLTTNYHRAARFDDCMMLVEKLVCAPYVSLVEFNIGAIQSIARMVAPGCQFKRQSQLPCGGRATELLISIVKAVGGDAYLAGGGAGGYQKDSYFSECGVELVYQQFRACPYGDKNSFMPGLSVIDYLMRDGRPLIDAFPEPK